MQQRQNERYPRQRRNARYGTTENHSNNILPLILRIYFLGLGLFVVVGLCIATDWRVALLSAIGGASIMLSTHKNLDI